MNTGWDIDPDHGDYLQENGRPVNTNSLRLPSYYRLKIRRKTWQYAPDDKYGCDFFKVAKRSTTQNNTKLEVIGARALQPIVDSGRASNVQLTTTLTARNGVSLDATITDAQGIVETVSFTSLGV